MLCAETSRLKAKLEKRGSKRERHADGSCVAGSVSPYHEHSSGSVNEKLARIVVVATPLHLLSTRISLLAATCSLQVAEAILEWSAGFAEEEGGDGQMPSPAEMCSTKDAEGKTAVVFAKEQVRLRLLYACRLT